MSEKSIIENTTTPLTIDTLRDELHRCGVTEGQTLLVHLALSKLGYVVGGAQAVIMALLKAIGESGTLMMVTGSGDNNNPAEWQNPPVPESWWQLIRDNTPAYDPTRTPTRSMGKVPELFRTWPEVLRSDHPNNSFAAYGPNADFLVKDHALTELAGNQSPIGKLYELDGHVLLLGVEHWNNTSLHLAEFRADYPGKKLLPAGAAMMVDGKRQWIEYEILIENPDEFGAIGKAFDEKHKIQVEKISNADVRVFRQRLVVDFAIDWIEENRDLTKS